MEEALAEHQNLENSKMMMIEALENQFLKTKNEESTGNLFNPSPEKKETMDIERYFGLKKKIEGYPNASATNSHRTGEKTTSLTKNRDVNITIKNY